MHSAGKCGTTASPLRWMHAISCRQRVRCSWFLCGSTLNASYAILRGKIAVAGPNNFISSLRKYLRLWQILAASLNILSRKFLRLLVHPSSGRSMSIFSISVRHMISKAQACACMFPVIESGNEKKASESCWCFTPGCCVTKYEGSVPFI
ncbi:hypothetical protein MPH_01165 [Macrophomina phaseolina MS6]|uniref:Uncharacterized protein n=1 Tax=Macrophomina phaseolina (strain MS6) TaxID=1126212 RepID=K2S9F3_MACPH|nr:hypothetical protein MPH_01165 [Macrophomina phaseolina MS6]